MTALVSITILPLLTGALGDRYAAYALLAGLLGWFALGDLGLGVAAQNYVAERRARGQEYSDIVVTALVAVLVVVGLVCSAGNFLGGWLGPIYLASASLSAEEAGAAFRVGASALSVTACGSVLYRIWYGEQRGYFSNIAPAVAALLALAAIAVGHWLGVTRLLVYVSAGLGPAAVVAVCAVGGRLWIEFRRGGRVRRSEFGLLLRRGQAFWAFAAMAAGVLYVDVLVASQYLQPSEIVTYTVCTRVFEMAQVFYSAVLLSLWPTWTELTTKGDWRTAMDVLRRYLVLGLVALAVFGVAMLWALEPILQVLVKSQAASVSTVFVLTLGGLAVARGWTNTYATVLQSTSRVGLLLIATPIQAVINLSLQILLVPRWGSTGLVASLLLSYLATTTWILPVAVRRLARAKVVA
ncbi:MAG: polysaccharide biosynthesis C-terminal domain-containing protein [Deltaproteobacteria bacterium]|nr:polysaccharide biosynthesis C-terminal domain-containing protein [Deltaproteobacteria bacterium]